MKSVNEILGRLKAALLTVTGQCYHYRRPPEPKAGYIIWMEDSEAAAIGADNKKAEQQIHGTIDYYTLLEFDPVIDDIQEALNMAEIGFRINSVQYEDETNLIHYEWEFWAA